MRALLDILTSFLGLLEIGSFPIYMYIFYVYTFYVIKIHTYWTIKSSRPFPGCLLLKTHPGNRRNDESESDDFAKVQHLTEGINKLKLGVTTELRDCEKEVELELVGFRDYLLTPESHKKNSENFFGQISLFLFFKISWWVDVADAEIPDIFFWGKNLRMNHLENYLEPPMQ